MIIELGLGLITGVAVAYAAYKHYGAVEIAAEIVTVKAEVKAAVTKAEATVATIKADLAKYL